MMNGYEALVATIMVALLTFGTRLVPFVLPRRESFPSLVEYFEGTVPGFSLVLLALYCLRDARWLAPPYGLPEIIGVTVVVILHLAKKNTLLSIVSGTVVYVLLVN
jgi:branched-subunit amino acid transport protein AzlD